MKTLELTLCYNCASVYRSMPDRTVKRKNYNQTVKEPCDICRMHRGYEYVIRDKYKKREDCYDKLQRKVFE